MKKVLLFLFSVLSYLAFIGTFVYAVCFVGNIYLVKSLDSEPLMPVVPALLIDGGLILLFSVQYNFLQSASLRKWMSRFVPESIERSAVVLLACANFFLLMWQWQPIGGFIWQVDNNVAKLILLIVILIGCAIIFISTFLINHFDFTGLRQTWMHLLNKPYQHPPFRDPLFYRLAKHPLQIGLVIALWATAEMTVAHLFFTLLTTAYVITSIQLEERQLQFQSGQRYTNSNNWFSAKVSTGKRKKDRMEVTKQQRRRIDAKLFS